MAGQTPAERGAACILACVVPTPDIRTSQECSGNKCYRPHHCLCLKSYMNLNLEPFSHILATRSQSPVLSSKVPGTGQLELGVGSSANLLCWKAVSLGALHSVPGAWGTSARASLCSSQPGAAAAGHLVQARRPGSHRSDRSQGSVGTTA